MLTCPSWKCHFGRGRQRAHALGIDKFRGDHQDEQERAGIHRNHPQALAAGAPQRLAALGRRIGKGSRLAALDLEQHHQGGQGDDGDEKEQVVADDGADQRHLLARRGKHAVFRKLVQAGNDQLRRHEEQNGSGDPEELLQIDAHAALDEHHAKHDGDDHARQRAQETEQFGGVQRDRSQDKDGFDSLAQDHQEDEEKQAKPGVAPARRPTLPSICPLSARPVFIMKMIMVTTKKAATSMIQPSKMS